MKKTKTQRGITLIALIITIIVLLVLAVVAIGVVQDSAIIGHAEDAKIKYGAGKEDEESKIEDYEAFLESKAPGENGGETETPTALDQKFLLFTHNESTLTSTFMGMNPKYKMENGYYGEDNYIITDLVIPSQVTNNGTTYDVTMVGENAMNSIETISKVIIPETVTAIGMTAFAGCSSLTTINIPSKVTTIRPNTFSGCTSLTDITIPESVTSIAPAFSDCTSLTTITIPKNVTSLSGPTFAGCTSLTTVTIEEGFNGSFQGPTFLGCTSLKTVHIPSSVTSMYSGPFSSCSSNTKIYVDKYEIDSFSWGRGWSGNATVIYKKTLQELDQKYFTYDLDTTNKTATITGLNPEYAEGRIKDSDGTTLRYYYYVIKDNNYIKDIIIPSKIIEDGEEYTVTTIGARAFDTGYWGVSSFGENQFDSFVIPNTVTTLGGLAFTNCASVYYVPSSVQNVGAPVFPQSSPSIRIIINKTKSECSSWPNTTNGSYFNWYGECNVQYKQ